MRKLGIMMLLTMMGILCACDQNRDPRNEEEVEMNYRMPAEDLLHEGTWLIWPHAYTYGEDYQNEIEGIWIEMVEALHTGENVHIIAYDKKAKERIEALLKSRTIDMGKIDFIIAKSDDVWVRDSGPIFVFDDHNNLAIADFKFDGWGKKAKYKKDDKLPQQVGKEKNIPVIEVADFVLEGGSIEVDGNGTLMATLSAVVSKNRNSKLTVKIAEEYLSKYLGITNFIWLEGVIDEDITDAHIDGIARFVNDNTLLTVSEEAFAELYEGINKADYNKLLNAKNAKNKKYEVKTLPLTKNNVQGLDYKGSYLNYYIGNEVVLVPVYKDENDQKAVDMIQEWYPHKKMVPIVVNALYQYGGMIHCVTQQQPLDKSYGENEI